MTNDSLLKKNFSFLYFKLFSTSFESCESRLHFKETMFTVNFYAYIQYFLKWIYISINLTFGYSSASK